MKENKGKIKNKSNLLIKSQYTSNSGKNTSIRNILRISEEDVRNRAYKIFLARAEQPGSPEADWYKAEEELIREKIIRKKNIINKIFLWQLN